ncbi:MAG: type VI secretion system baseplate subunit TssF [Burkholderiales bacterium]|nr:type VI secretion system baseplate subunit TssF [Burkholderiales bacterium]
MDPRLLDYYNQELQYIREMGAEFAQEYPKIAARLALSGIECADPYVERLLEGFAFLTARVQLRIDAEFPRFTQQLLQMVYPDYLVPMPSMVVAQVQPDLSEAGLAKGYEIPRAAALNAQRSLDAATACQYRTAHSLTLWPLQVTQASYRAYAGDFPPDLPLARTPQAVLRLRLSVSGNLKFSQLALSTLPLYLCGPDNIAYRLYETLLADARGAYFSIPGQRRLLGRFLTRDCIRDLGFRDSQALLPPGPRTFQGHRLLQEYMAFPQRYLFVELAQLERCLRQAEVSEVELTIALAHHERTLEDSVSHADFALHCVPAINLFPKRTDRIHTDGLRAEYHVVPDRTRPMDFEVFRVNAVTGYGEGIETQREFLPFYALYDQRLDQDTNAYFTLRREPRVLSDKQRRVGPRTSYVGSEVFISLVDGREAPFSADLRQLGVETLCTNRDLPLRMPLGSPRGDFVLDTTGPVQSIRCIKGPSLPVSAHLAGESSWRLIGLLSQNYLSLVDTGPREGAEALRELLTLCAAQFEAHTRKQISGLRSAACAQVVRRLPTRGPVAFGRGIEVTLEIDESSLGGMGALLFGSVLRHFLGRHVSLNSFAEVVLKVTGRGEVVRWPPSIGARAVI